MRSATVVLPVPGLPVKLMCRLGACADRPRFMRSLSITSSAAMSRMRALIGVRPTRSRSSSSITPPAWLCASTSLTVRAWADCGPWAAVAPVAGSGTGDAVPAALPGIEYSSEPTSGHLARRRRAAQFVAHRIDHRLIVRAAEYRAAGDEGVGTGGRDAADVVDLDAAVDLEPDIPARGVNEFARALDLPQRRVNEALATKARIDAHDEHQIDLIENVLEHLERSGRIEGQPRAAARRLDQAQGPIHVQRSFGMEADHVGAGGDEAVDERIHRPHHQMHVQRRVCALRPCAIGLQRRGHHWPDGQVRDEVIVHDVEVNPVGTRGNDATHFLAQTG